MHTPNYAIYFVMFEFECDEIGFKKKKKKKSRHRLK